MMLIIRSLPWIPDLEMKLLYERKAYENAEADYCEYVSKKLFGFWATYEEEIFEEHYEKLFYSHLLADDEVMATLLTLGLDFSDERGNPLRCTLGLALPAELAARGIAGHLPDNVDRFASNLQRDRDAFIASKRSART